MAELTNNFDTAQLPAKLLGRIGWEQPTQTGAVVLTDENKASKTGTYFNQYHPLVSLQALRAVIEDGGLDDAGFNALLQSWYTDSVIQVLNGILNDQQLIQGNYIFDRLRRNDIPLPNQGNFCGYRFWVAPGEFAVQLSKVSFLFTEDCQFNLYLFQDANTKPIYSPIPVTVTGGNETYLELPNWVMRYADKTSGVMGGVWHFGYFQDEIGTSQAVDEFVSQWNKSYALGYTAFESPILPGVRDFNRQSIPYTYKTYGMNVEYQELRDYTNLVVNNPSQFDEAVRISMAIKVMQQIYFSQRTNATERITKEMAMLLYGEVNGNGSKISSTFKGGLKIDLERELARIRKQFLNSPFSEFSTTRPYEWAVSSNPMIRV